MQTPKILKRFELYGYEVNYDNLGKLVSVDETIRDWLYSEEIANNLYRKGDVESTEDKNQPINTFFKANNKWLINTKDGVFNVFRYQDRIGVCDDYFGKFGERQVRGNLWKGFSSDGGNLDKEGFVSFKNGKKPLRLIKQLIHSVCIKPNAKILDFFAGSGTTGHAVLDLNFSDGGKRTFILCQMEEITEETPNGIAKDVTCKRLKRVMTGSCYDANSNYIIPRKFKPYGGKLEVYEIAEVRNDCSTEGETPFDVIDETLYGKEKFRSMREKIDWVCQNFERTQYTVPEIKV